MYRLPLFRPLAAAAILGTVALMTLSCAAPVRIGRAPSASVALPRLPGLVAPVTKGPVALDALALEEDALATEPVAEPAPVESTETVEAVEAVEEAPAPEPIGPLPGGTAYMPEVERWRGLVRELIAEARAEGYLEGNAGRLDEDLVLAVIQQESGGDPDAMSWAGARGLMQLMPPSFAWIMGIANWGQDISHLDPNFIFDPSTNLRAGIRFLGAVLEEQGGSVYWALASYNAGGGHVNAWRWSGATEVPASYGGGETAHYVPAILGNYNAHRPA